LQIFNALGQYVRTLVDEVQQPGLKEITWDGRDENGHVSAAGVYIYKLQAGGFSSSKKIIFVK
jgi:flagellar hook assembly protein FlgD